MRIPLRALSLAAGIVAPAVLSAQDVVPPSLSLEDALRIAEGSNPAYLQTRNDAQLAEWDVRQAWGRLLPSANASSTIGWRGTGDQQFGSITLGDLGFGSQPSIYSSSYSLGLSYNLDLASWVAPSRARIERDVTTARILSANVGLTARVTRAYLEVLRQREAVRLAEQQLENSRFNLRLARGQLEVGGATPIDVGQAEVQVGRGEVTLLQTQNARETARMRLLQQLGVPVNQSPQLTTEFVLSEPTWELGALYARALTTNPGLGAARLSEDAAEIGVTQARSAYFPSVSVSTGLSGFSQQASSVDSRIAQAQGQVASAVASCAQTNELFSRLADPLPLQDCGRFAFTDADRQQIISENDKFPFNFTRSPPSVSMTVSVPVFQGFSRQRNLEAARLQREDLSQQYREQEIALRADLSVALANARTAYQSALLEARNRDLAEQQLRLARERYQLGVISFVELVDAQTVLAQADRDRIAAIFAYHDLVTDLEALVGTSLRNR